MNGEARAIEREPLEAAFTDARCINCGAPAMYWLRCRRCEGQYQTEQRLYRSGP